MGRKLIPFNDQVFPEPNTGCWLWAGYTNDRHYGQVPGAKHNGFNLAHRYSYFLTHGDFDRSLHVCHKCDNTYCVNPDHLFLGTHQDNMLDRKNKGRIASGSKIRRSKLTEHQVLEIRRKFENGERQCVLMREYGIKDGAISKIVNRKNWKHI